jgi:hypothetical protein
MTFNFYSEFSDSKIILINIQKKYPKLHIKALFQLENGDLKLIDYYSELIMEKNP